MFQVSAVLSELISEILQGSAWDRLLHTESRWGPYDALADLFILPVVVHYVIEMHYF